MKSGFWVFVNLTNMYKFSDRLIRNEVYVIQDLLVKKSWDFGGVLIIPYATGKARKLRCSIQCSFSVADFLIC